MADHIQQPAAGVQQALAVVGSNVQQIVRHCERQMQPLQQTVALLLGGMQQQWAAHMQQQLQRQRHARLHQQQLWAPALAVSCRCCC